ncbi:MAG: thioredoxin family protein [Candidatus Saccharimonas sp.]
MNKKTVIIVITLTSIIVGALLYVALTRGQMHERMTNEMTTMEESKPEVITEQPETDVDSVANQGSYVPYDEAKLAVTEGDILLFFHASWCPQCRAIEKSIYNEGIPNNVTIYKIDYDTNQALRQRYGVTLQTTFVKVDAKGNKLASFVAYSEPSFSAVRQRLLP